MCSLPIGIFTAARGEYFIQQSLIRWSEQTVKLLESRRDLDAQQNSISQAQALLLESRARLVETKATIRSLQDRLYRLINAPMLDSRVNEILPTASPQESEHLWELQPELEEAFAHRPEIAQALSNIREAGVVHHVSLNLLLPRLTFTLQSSLNGLDENFDSYGALGNATDIAQAPARHPITRRQRACPIDRVPELVHLD